MNLFDDKNARSNSLTEFAVCRRTLLGALAGAVPALLLDVPAVAQTLRGDELPLHTTGLEHIGMVVPDTTATARFYSSVFNPDMQKEKDAPLRYYVMTGSGYIAIGSRAGVTEAKVDHYCTLVQGYDRERMNTTLAGKGMPAASRGVVPDPDGVGLQLIAVPGGPGPTAVPGGRLVETEALVKPIGFDSILLRVADLRRSADFYSVFFNAAPVAEKGQMAFDAAGTRIVLRSLASGELAGVDRFGFRVASFDRDKLVKGLVALGAKQAEATGAGVVRFRDLNGLAVELKAV